MSSEIWQMYEYILSGQGLGDKPEHICKMSGVSTVVQDELYLCI